MKTSASLLLGLLGLVAHVGADPTWPSEIDELEEIMYQVFSFRSRKFADTVSPCSNEASGPGRHNAAEWLRTAFHDMSTANTVQGFGGLDASLQYELTNSENLGPGFGTTMSFMSPYFSRKSSMSDLIAMGVYTSVRSCGGPVVPFRAGRRDATTSGNTGVPQPQNEIGTFRNQFDRMGFTPQEMIQVTACGHTIGGVHSNEFPDIVPKGSAPNEQQGLDATDAVFDNKVVTEYLDGTTTNPLVVGPAVAIKKHSDFKVFSSDGNVTMRAMADATAFNNVCKTVLQKMIDVVPPGVALGTPILPYMIKPVNLQLTLATGGTVLTFTGYIRVKTTDLPAANIAGLTINYKNRNGGTTCGSGPCTLSLTVQGIGRGFDDTFAFYPITANLPVTSGISSFTVTVRKTDGSSTLYDNNGSGYPIQDGILLQTPQSCLLQGTGATTIVAAVRNDRATLPAKVFISYKAKRTTTVVPSLNNVTLEMTKGDCVGSYTFFSASYTIPGQLSFESFVDVISGDGVSAVSDSFKDVNEIGGTCQAYTPPATCASVTVSSSSVVPTSTRTSTSSVAVSTTSSAAPTATLGHQPIVGKYSFVGCQTEGDGVRALSGAATAADDMTLEKCAAFCSTFLWFGVEYGRECYCGNTVAASSLPAPIGECNMICAGSPYQYCGAGNRLDMYSSGVATSSTLSTSTKPATTSSSTTKPSSSSTKPASSTSTPISTSTSKASSSTVSSATATPTLSHQPTVGKYSFVGCQTEGTGVRALSGAATAADDMTLEKCATFCSAYAYFGVEYGRECYCGNTVAASALPAPIGDCNMICAGSPYQYCGAGNRLDLYSSLVSTTLGTSTKLSTSSTTKPATSTSTSKPASSTVPSTSSKPTSTSTSKASTSTVPTTSSKPSSTSRPTTSSRSSSSTRITSTSTLRSTSSVRTSTTSTRSSSTSKPTSSTRSTSTNTSKVSTSTTKVSTSTSTVPTLAHKPTVSPYSLVGCWTEGVGVRALSQKSYASGDLMTLESCATFCSAYKFFGVEYGSECYCGDYTAASSKSAPLTDCSMTCSGDPFEYCGAGSRLTLYQKDGPVTGPSQPATIGAYNFLGCQTETTIGPRALSAATTSSDNMTNEVCAAFCASYSHFGTQYGRECYCGSALSTESVVAPVTECSMLCSGTSSEFCGGVSRLSVYRKTP